MVIGAVVVAATACSSTATTPTAITTPVAETTTSASSTTTAESTINAPSSTVGDVATTESTAGQPQGFTTVEAIITAADGEVCEVCLWFANDTGKYGRGLMEVTDLGEPVGMVFAYANDRSGNFFMFDTPTPLSIAWFAGDGSFIAATDMDPCLVADSATCPRFNPGAPYRFAVEVPQGDLGALGIGPGSTFELVPGSESPLGMPCSPR